ncbi:SDR family oxidoreductase [Actinomadura coerulea]|uniref:SDR family oxidoreductase n=1 Tax=Actinomadura coerulea TaxID=46159 RepID=UPI00342149AB
MAADGVRVNALAPGPTESEALTAAGLPEAAVEQIKQDEAARIPLGRRGDPAEIATWILRLADPSTTWLTGQILTPRRRPGSHLRGRRGAPVTWRR